MWSQPGDVEKSGAWRQSRPGLSLVRAMVEGKHVIRRTTEVLTECDGHDFVMFEWLALARLNPFGLRGKSGTPPTTLGGLSIVSREEITTVLLTGEVLRKPRPEAHKRTGFATYGM